MLVKVHSSVNVTVQHKAKFHYAIWSQTGPQLAQTCSELEFGLSSSSLAAS